MCGTYLKNKWKMSAVILAGLMAVGCKNAPEPVPPTTIVKEPLVLGEIRPLPKTVIDVQAQPVDLEPVYNIFKIMETTEVNGVQRSVVARVGTDRTNIKVGTTGDIAINETFAEIIGNYKIVELYGNFFRCDIVSLNRRIGANAYIRVQIGEQPKVVGEKAKEEKEK